MLESVWQQVSEASGRRWVLICLVPAALFWAACGLTYYGLWLGWNQTLAWWGGLPDASRSLLLLAVIIPIGLTAFGLDMIGPLLSRIGEGYWNFPPVLGPWLYERRRWYWSERFQANRQRLETLIQREHPELAAEVNALPLTGKERREIVRIERELHDAPQQKVMPTRLGNILRAAEEDQFWRYGLDAVIVWPRLYPLLSEVLRRELDDARAALDAATRTSSLALLFSLIWGLQAFRHQSWLLSGVAFFGFGSAFLTYYTAIQSATLYAELIRSAFDLYRFDLYRALHLSLPPTSDAECESGKLITAFLWRGNEITYKHQE